MPSPFPGMDPWLEHPDIFPDLHHSFIVYLSGRLNAKLEAPYFSTIVGRDWIESEGSASPKPDFWVRSSAPLPIEPIANRGPNVIKVRAMIGECPIVNFRLTHH